MAQLRCLFFVRDGKKFLLSGVGCRVARLLLVQNTKNGEKLQNDR
jgi:hypothetical protein